MPYIRKIVTDNHPTLRKVAKKVDLAELRDPIMQQLFDDMLATMYAANGIGLAAPQINISKRIFTLHLEDDEVEHGPYIVVNPKFTLTEGEMESTEGCLSVPGFIGELERYSKVEVTGLDRHGEKITIGGGGLLARCLQHEIDHLNGVLYVDKARNIRPAETDEEKAAAAEAAEEAAGIAAVNGDGVSAQ